MAAVAVLPPSAHIGDGGDKTGNAAALLALLQEDDTALQAEALRRLWNDIDFCWMDMTKDDITLVEELSEDEEFQLRDLAAAVASKFYYHLEQYEDAVEFALRSGEYFNVETKSEYVDTIVAKCIDTYIAKRQKEANANAKPGAASTTGADGASKEGGETSEFDEKLSCIVEKMFERCNEHGQHMQALGIALEARRLDQVERAILDSSDRRGLLGFCFDFCRLQISNRGFRHAAFRILARLYRTSCATPDYVNVCQCLQFLGEAPSVAEVLLKLLTGSEEEALVSYQVAFRIDENENQQFMRDVLKALPSVEEPKPAAAETTAAATETETAADASTATADSAAAVAAAQTKVAEPAEAVETAAAAAVEMTPELRQRLKRLGRILDGRATIKLNLDFLIVHNKTDLLVLRNIKEAVGTRVSVLHTATVVAHAYMNCGTTQHTFLRNNEEWLRKATNWSRFTAIAGLGVVHKGHLSESLEILKPYMPTTPTQVSAQPFCEGGAYFALGLMHANKGWTDGGKMVNFLLAKLKSTRDNTVRHGACLGIGCAAMGSGGADISSALKKALQDLDDAVAGEGAAYGLGLLNVGRGTAAAAEIEEMLAYAHATQHEKIIRGLCLGVAMIMYGQEEVADALVEQMVRDKDHIIRYGGCFALAMAYCGTSNNEAVGRLLHVAVSDVNQNVRRAAVMSLGFVMFRHPEKMPQLVSLLSISYCPHVRYGACLAVGVACAGTGLQSAIDMLWPLMTDKVDFVRQGAFMALAMVLQEQSPAACKKLAPFIEKLNAVIKDKHQPTMAKMGAVLAFGILNAGGRNVTIALTSNAGFKKMASIVGLMLSLQYWYWYPLMHFMSLSFTPTALIGLDKEMRMPVGFAATCNAKASLFAYVEPLEEKKEEKKERVKTVELSTTAKARKRKKKLERQKSGGNPEPEEGETTEGKKEGDETVPAPMDEEADEKEGATKEGETTEGEEEAAKKKADAGPEPEFFALGNPCRVTRSQRPHIVFNAGNRYTAVLPDAQCALGIVMLRDGQPSKPQEYVEVNRDLIGGEDVEPSPPKDFIWTPPPKTSTK